MENIRTSKIFSLLIIIYGTYVVWDVAINVNIYMWDYRANYNSTICFEQNLNPYSIEDLSTVVKREMILPYVYPPLTINFYKIFNFDNIESAAIVFLLFKTFLLVLLILLWQNILNIKIDNIFYLFILLAFNSAVYIDLRVGNITIIVQFLLWLGLYFYLKRKYVLFCVFVILAAAFKIIPVIFLVLILFTKDKRKYLYLAGSSLGFIFYLLLNYLIYPFLFTEFIQSTFNTFEARGRGITHPALYSFIRDALNQLYIVKLRDLLGIDLTSIIELLIFIIIISLILLVTFRSIKKMNDESNVLNIDKGLIVVSLFCILFSFLMPRFKDYDYILLILPAFFIINKAEFIKPIFLLVFIFIISSTKVTLPGIKILYKFLWDYYPLFQAIIVWILYILYIKKFSTAAESKTLQDNLQQ